MASSRIARFLRHADRDDGLVRTPWRLGSLPAARVEEAHPARREVELDPVAGEEAPAEHAVLPPGPGGRVAGSGVDPELQVASQEGRAPVGTLLDAPDHHAEGARDPRRHHTGRSTGVEEQPQGASAALGSEVDQDANRLRRVEERERREHRVGRHVVPGPDRRRQEQHRQRDCGDRGDDPDDV
jgi:hypothetical protein